MKNLGDIGPSKFSVITILIYLIRFHFVYYSFVILFPYRNLPKKEEVRRKCDRPLYLISVIHTAFVPYDFVSCKERHHQYVFTNVLICLFY